MLSKKINNKILVRVDKGEELVESLMKVCKEYNVKLGTISGIGATNKVKVGLFDVEKKQYFSSEFDRNFEITSLLGNVSTMNNETYLHLHINVCDDKHNCYGGHLNYAYISATFEGFIEIIDDEIDREFSEEVGLNLMKF